MIIDSHAHLTADDAFDDLPDMLQRAKESGVEAIVNICTDLPSLQRGLALKEKYPWIYHAAAIPPHDAHLDCEDYYLALSQAAKEGNFVAIGEMGLEYHYGYEHKEKQQADLIRHLHLANDLDLPVVIHCRDGFADFFSCIDQHFPSHRGVLHCFTGTLEEAKELIARDWYLSLSGIVTFKKSDALREVARFVPLSHLLVETDAPYLAPQSRRGKRNEPAFIHETIDLIASVKEISRDEVIRATTDNAKTLFSLVSG
ncbi:MAG: TatD family hydrolase [Chlamydiia bacterium]|nr:TatD family hydrolase [Chlamydiia bacterium]